MAVEATLTQLKKKTYKNCNTTTSYAYFLFPAQLVATSKEKTC